MAEIEAIVCDFGGVLTSPLRDAFAAMEADFGVTPEEFGTAMRAVTEPDGEIPLFPLERGEMTEDDFLGLLGDGFERTIGRRPPLESFGDSLFAGLMPNEPMIELMRELRGEGYRMVILTNNVREWEPLWRSMLAVEEIFEDVIDSAYVGARKPEPRIFELTAGRLELPPEACLLVDDMELNVEGAREFGMGAVLYTDAEETRTAIRAALDGDDA